MTAKTHPPLEPGHDDPGWPSKRRVTLAGAAVNLVLAAGKILFGWIGNSQALVADGVHSLSDLISDALVLVAARLGSRKADHNHPYGHGRIETAATGAMGILLLAVAGGFIVDASGRLLEPERLPTPGLVALAAAVASVLVKEALFHYTRRVARRVESPLIAANAWHHRSDALSSLVVIGGIVGAMLGAPWLDAVAAILVAGMIGRMGWDFGSDALRELVDTGLETHETQALRRRILAVPGVLGERQLRSRRMGPRVLVDVHILVDGGISLREAHRIAQDVRRRLLNHDDAVSDVVVSVEPADRPGADR
ncbi:MAG: cation transporter [Ectothiorhodospiraceae bacterium]|nr:cation transporter [Ectothiorhodospiraceae bacterium]